jgi:hypothetical protein
MNRFLSTSAIVTLLATPAFAQEITFGQADLNYDRISNGSDEASATTFGGEVEYSIDQFLLGVNLTSKTTDFAFGDLTIRNYGAFAGYSGIDGVLVGAGVTGISFEEGGSSDSENGYEVFAQYTTGQFGAAVNYAVPFSDDDDFTITTFFAEANVTPDAAIGAVIEQNDDFDETIYHLSADYAAGPISGRAYYFGVTDVDGSVLGLDGSYAINDMIDVTAAFQTGDLFGDFNVLSIGASYEVSDGFAIGGSIGQLTSDAEDDITTFQLSLEYTVGSQQRMDRRMGDAARADLQEGFSAVYPTFEFSIFPGFF